jgi:hypothetical protein
LVQELIQLGAEKQAKNIHGQTPYDLTENPIIEQMLCETKRPKVERITELTDVWDCAELNAVATATRLLKHSESNRRWIEKAGFWDLTPLRI